VSDIRPAAIRTGNDDAQSCCISRGKKNFWPGGKNNAAKIYCCIILSYALSSDNIIEQ